VTDAEHIRWMEIIDALRGSCASIHDKLNEDEEGLELNSEFCELLDSELMMCNTCGWWAETHEVDDMGDCAECQDEEED
jgi:hypothetical protein